MGHPAFLCKMSVLSVAKGQNERPFAAGMKEPELCSKTAVFAVFKKLQFSKLQRNSVCG